MYEIDARGQACPMPVVLTKRALKQTPKDTLKVMVDNEIATQNLTKMAVQLGLNASVTKKDAHHYDVYVSSESSTLSPASEKYQAKERKIPQESEEVPYIVVLNAETVGQGPEALGKTLLNSFVFALSEQDQLPDVVVCYNGGAKLTTEGSPVLGDLRALEAAGTEILTCGICLEYFDLTDKLAVGSVTNMYRIVELERSMKTVSP